MNKNFALILFTVLSSLCFLHTHSAKVKVPTCDQKKCPSLPKHYEELGCEASPINVDDCCVRSFKCPDLSTRDFNKCYFKNETYQLREQLKDYQLTGTCNGQCICSEGRDEEPAQFMCASLDCPEFFHNYEDTKKCIMQYDREHCCAIDTVCEDEADKWDSLATCDFEGETYRQGQKIYPNDVCYSCFCTKNFNNETAIEENPSCQKIDCGISLRNTGRLFDGCVPIYYKNDKCCPIGWKCPEDEDLPLNSNFSRKNEIDPICKFGSLKFNIGEKMNMGEEDSCRTCTCLVPPMLTCIEDC